MKKRHTLYTITIIIATMMAGACGRQEKASVRANNADSIIYAVGDQWQFERVLELTDSFQKAGDISEVNANRWRGVAYFRMGQYRTAEYYYKKVINADITNEQDQFNYNKAARRLANILVTKGDYEGALRVALPAVEKIKESGTGSTNDFAFLYNTIGCCQIHLRQDNDAAISFDRSYDYFLEKADTDATGHGFYDAMVGVSSTANDYLSMKKYREASLWVDRLEEMLPRYASFPNAPDSLIDDFRGRIFLSKALILQAEGLPKEAEGAYKDLLSTKYSRTIMGRIDANDYLIGAERWSAAADNYHDLWRLFHDHGMPMSLGNIQQFLLPKYRANVGAQRRDSAIAIGAFICDALDSAIVKSSEDDAAELATIYATQQKEAKIAQQQNDLARQRWISTLIALSLLTIFFTIYTLHRRQAQRHLAAANQQLEAANQKLEHSNSRLQTLNAELQTANARAEESSRMKTNFIQQISHEIRTPLNILSGFTQIVTTPGMELDDATRTDINNQITDNTNRITGLVNKMLELSDVSSQTVIERNDQVLAIQIAAQAAEDSGIGTAKHLTFDMQIAPEAESVMLQTNERQATRALSLLLDNAQKFTKEGHAKLQVGSDGQMLSFTIEDTGIGVPPEEAEHIFEEFVQLDDYYHGTGIGLTVARSIARRLGGDIVLDTGYTGGARFVMTLPE